MAVFRAGNQGRQSGVHRATFRASPARPSGLKSLSFQLSPILLARITGPLTDDQNGPVPCNPSANCNQSCMSMPGSEACNIPRCQNLVNGHCNPISIQFWFLPNLYFFQDHMYVPRVKLTLPSIWITQQMSLTEKYSRTPSCGHPAFVDTPPL